MKILFICTAFNSLSQRVALVLRSKGHAVTVELALSPDAMTIAAQLASPDIIICPFLTKRVPPAVYNRWLTLIVHPGPPGDAGPSALDWTLMGDLGECEDADAELAMIDAAHSNITPGRRMRSHWGVTVLQAIEAFDAGPVWAFDQFELDQYTGSMSKSDLYRGPVTQAAVNAVLSAIEIVRIVATQTHGQETFPANLQAPDFARHHCVSRGLPFQGGKTHDRPLLKASSRDFFGIGLTHQNQISADTIVQRIRCADSQPGVLTKLFGTPMFVYNATVQKDRLPEHIASRANSGGPGTVLATRDGAVLVEIGADHPIWISHLRRPKAKTDKYLHPKLPATMALLSVPGLSVKLGLLSDVEEWSIVNDKDIDTSLPWQKREGTYQQVWVELQSYGNAGSQIGYIHYEFYNGAFSTSQCEMLLRAINWTLSQSHLKAIVILGGSGYFSNGIALNVIEGAPDPSAEGWANINAIDDCVQALLAPAGVVTFAAIRGNAAAGGLALATAADVVLCTESAVLNPHYRGVGLFGSEWHTYSWYERCGADVAAKLARDMLPISSSEACKLGLVDHVINNNKMNSDQLLTNIRSIVTNIMTAKAIDAKYHVGAPWTKPLRSSHVQAQFSLSDHMLRNKTKFLAYTFSGDGDDGLTFEEHFQLYRKLELDQMTLDFFHPHRNKRFASRCTGFVRKLVPDSTPLRFALHRRYEGGRWEEATSDFIRRDEEELDEFDDLGHFPASAVVTRSPLWRPEYIRRPDTTREKETEEPQTCRPDLNRRNSSATTMASLCSDVTGVSDSSPTPLSPSTPNTPLSMSLVSLTDKLNEGVAMGKMQDNIAAADQHLPILLPIDVFDLKQSCSDTACMLADDDTLVDKTSQAPSNILWGCYFSENGSERQLVTTD